jgi:hypothetical protein
VTLSDGDVIVTSHGQLNISLGEEGDLSSINWPITELMVRFAPQHTASVGKHVKKSLFSLTTRQIVYAKILKAYRR